MSESNIRILVVEDEEILKQMLVEIFEDEGYLVDSASNGREAWELMNESEYHVLLTDMFMPEMNGIELLEKCEEMFPAMKRILCSGGGQGIEAEHGQQSVEYNGCSMQVDMFLRKPCKLEELISAVKNLKL